MDDDRVVISSGLVFSPETVAARTFSVVFRGYEQTEVRAFLTRVAEEMAGAADREAELQQSLHDALGRAAHPEVDEDALTNALGEHAARLLTSAREAASAMISDAETRSARILQESESKIARARADADTLLARRTEEAERMTVGLRQAAEAEARGVRERARAEAEAEVESARTQGREMVAEARSVRERMLADLTRRQRVAEAQVEQLMAVRQRLLQAYGVVRRTVDEATTELRKAESDTDPATEAAGDAAPTGLIPIVRPDDPASRPGPRFAPQPAPRPVGLPSAEPPTAEPPTAERPTGERPTAGPQAAGPQTAERPTAERPIAGSSAPEPRPSVLEAQRRRPRPIPTSRPVQQAGPARPFGGLGTVPPPGQDAPPLAHPVHPVTVVPGPATSAPPPEPPAPEASTAPTVDELFARVRAGQVPGESGAEVSPAPAAPAPPHPTPPPQAAAPSAASPPAAPAPAATRPAARPAPAAPPPAPAPRAAMAGPMAAVPTAAASPPTAAAPTAAASPPAPGATSAQHAAEDTAEDTADTPADAPVAPSADESILYRRDELLDPIDADLVRQLKRVLQDEQNEVLDRLRRQRQPAAEATLPDLVAHTDRYQIVAAPLLRAAAHRGAGFVAAVSDGPVELKEPSERSAEEWAADLAVDIVLPLRERLEAALNEVDAGADAAAGPDATIADRLSANYRQWKVQQVEQIARHHATVAFVRGVFAAAPEGSALRWIVDDEVPCPDCDDNALAGPTPKGQTFPTGQRHPPAHQGCRCVVVTVTSS